MNRLLEKFLKKTVILQNITVISQNDTEAVLSIPISIGVERKWNHDHDLSFQPVTRVTPTLVPVPCLATTDKNSELSHAFNNKGLAIIGLTKAGSSKTSDELAKELPEDLYAFYLNKKKD